MLHPLAHPCCSIFQKPLVAEWLEQASQWHAIYYHDLEVMSSNANHVELRVRSTSVLSCTWTKKLYISINEQSFSLCCCPFCLFICFLLLLKSPFPYSNPTAFVLCCCTVQKVDSFILIFPFCPLHLIWLFLLRLYYFIAARIGQIAQSIYIAQAGQLGQ